MTEKNLNRDLIALFKKSGAQAYKLPDPNKSAVLNSAKIPFDGFARFPPPVNDFWFESKLIKNKVSAFNTSRVKPHQLEALKKIKLNGGRAAVVLGCWVPRKEYWFMAFDVEFIAGLRGMSLKRKDLLDFCEKGYNIPLRCKDGPLFSPALLIEKMIVSFGGGG